MDAPAYVSFPAGSVQEGTYESTTHMMDESGVRGGNAFKGGPMGQEEYESLVDQYNSLMEEASAARAKAMADAAKAVEEAAAEEAAAGAAEALDEEVAVALAAGGPFTAVLEAIAVAIAIGAAVALGLAVQRYDKAMLDYNKAVSMPLPSPPPRPPITPPRPTPPVIPTALPPTVPNIMRIVDLSYLPTFTRRRRKRFLSFLR